MSWFWLDQIDKELDDALKIKQMETEYCELAEAKASASVKAQHVLDCLIHIEFMTIKCPTCGAKRDEDGILAHRKTCYLSNTLRSANAK